MAKCIIVLTDGLSGDIVDLKTEFDPPLPGKSPDGRIHFATPAQQMAVDMVIYAAEKAARPVPGRPA